MVEEFRAPAVPERRTVTIDVAALFLRHGDTARFRLLERYEAEALEAAGRGNDIVLTGRGPVWLYLRLAHVLHGVARSLTYRSGQDEEVPIFDHAAG